MSMFTILRNMNTGLVLHNAQFIVLCMIFYGVWDSEGCMTLYYKRTIHCTCMECFYNKSTVLYLECILSFQCERLLQYKYSWCAFADNHYQFTRLVVEWFMTFPS